MSQRKPMTAMALEDLPERELTAAQEEAVKGGEYAVATEDDEEGNGSNEKGYPGHAGLSLGG